MIYKKMFINRLLLLSVILILYGCGNKNYFLKSSTSLRDVQKIDYFSPVFSFENDSVVYSRASVGFVKYTNRVVDSLFANDKYRINNKLIAKDQDTSIAIIKEISNLFEKVIRVGSIENVEIPPTINPFLNAQNLRYALALYLKPSFVSSKEKFPNYIIIGNNNGKFLKSYEVHLIIFDILNDEIAFYGRYASRVNGRKGYAIIPILEEAIMSIYKKA
ncbi:MAG TPA: hypothetical protein VFI78_02425 [Salinimicrobium sp.]|nr:hypothetical protein [Salinimicrobium sp.]